MARDFIPGRHEPEIPSNTFAYFFREACRRIWIAKRTSFVAVAMIAISLLILGLFLLLSENLNRAVAKWQERSRVAIYLNADVKPEQIRDVDQFLAAHAELAGRRFVTRDEALRRFKNNFVNLNEVVGQLGENPFPPSFECDVPPRIVQTRAFQQEMDAIRALPAVEQVELDFEWVKRLRRIITIVDLAGFVAGGILAIAAAFTIANVIRLTMMLYHEEIEIMRLVGATERIIRGPFLIEGLLQGTIGGVLAVLLLLALYLTGQHFLAPASSLVWGFLFTGFLPWPKIAGLVAGGTLAGWIGSWLSVRERGVQ
ncbi:MAG TPA: ABC transporter permease [Thermoanaerobaculia bacterium]|nr:ABC transporter permease [Thermoanaerobaculia bacterium]